MPRFYFHLRDRDELITDGEGIELPDESAALHEAMEGARDLLADAIKAGREWVPEAFVIADEQGREIASLPLESVLPKPLKK